MVCVWLSEPAAPHAAVEKPFLLSGGAVRLEARLDRAIYAHGDSITVHVSVTNDSHKSVKRVQVIHLFRHNISLLPHFTQK